jgi:hypothetical protein
MCRYGAHSRYRHGCDLAGSRQLAFQCRGQIASTPPPQRLEADMERNEQPDGELTGRSGKPGSHTGCQPPTPSTRRATLSASAGRPYLGSGGIPGFSIQTFPLAGNLKPPRRHCRILYQQHPRVAQDRPAGNPGQWARRGTARKETCNPLYHETSHPVHHGALARCIYCIRVCSNTPAKRATVPSDPV